MMAEADPLELSPGNRLRAYRKAAGLTLRKLGELIGQRHSTISYWENANKVPRSEVLPALADALGVSVDEILGRPRVNGQGGPAGRARIVFEQVSQLPRRQQTKVLDTVEILLAGQIARQHSSEVSS